MQVNGTDGLPVPGATVNFAAATGGGSVDSATATADANGVARTGATLGGVIGAQTFTASAPGVAAVTFTATANSGSGVKVWTGTVSSSWNTPGNWNPAAVPVAGDSVEVPKVATAQPVLGGSATIRTLVLSGVSAQASVGGTLTVTGAVILKDSLDTLTFTSGGLVAGSVNLAGGAAVLNTGAATMTVSGTTTIGGASASITAGNGSSFGPVTLSGGQSLLSLAGTATLGPVVVSGPNGSVTTASSPVSITGTPALQVSGANAAAHIGNGSTITGDVIVSGTPANFSATGGGATITGNLTTSGGGTVTSTLSPDTLRVSGNATFGGGDESTRLSAGAMYVGGNFSQTGAGTTFVGTGSFTVFLNGNGAQTLNFAAPGFAAARFQNVIIANSAGLVQATSDIYATGTAGVTPTAVRTLSGNGSTLFTTILNVSNFTFNNLLLNFAGSTVVTFDTVTFQGYAPTATPLTISHPGTAAALSFLNVSFGVVPTTGFYLKATDSNPSDGVPLVIDMTNPSPLSGGSFVQTVGGATVNWPAGVAPGTWTGAVDTAWFTAGNWSDGNVPTTTTDVTIPSGAPQAPTITGTIANAHNLLVQSGATLNMNLGGLNLSGSLDAQGPISGTTTSVNLTGTGTVRGTLTGTNFSTLVNGTYSLGGRLVTPGMTINGTLTLAGFTASVGSSAGDDFQTSNNGVLVMTGAADSLIVGGTGPSLVFDGGSTAGKLTAGVILMNNATFASFTQGRTFSDSSFAPTGSHKVVFAGAGSINLTMASPNVGSHFNILDISAQTAGMSLSSNIQVNGLFISTPSSGSPAINGGSNRFSVGGGTQVTGLTLTNAPLIINGGSSFQFDNVTFQSMPTSASQLSGSLPGFATPLVFNNLVFSTVPTTGFYVDLADSDGPSPNALVVNMVNPTPATPSGFSPGYQRRRDQLAGGLPSQDLDRGGEHRLEHRRQLELGKRSHQRR